MGSSKLLKLKLVKSEAVFYHSLFFHGYTRLLVIFMHIYTVKRRERSSPLKLKLGQPSVSNFIFVALVYQGW